MSSSPGTLYVVATPIGHLEDITLRALRVLAEVDGIAAEDTRETGKLLRRHGIEGRLTAYHEHNEAQRTPELVTRLQGGESLAVVSDAGTPSVSDPGYRLVEAAAAAGIRVVPVPGVSAAVTALSAAGLPTDAFTFVGFAPRRDGPRRRLLEALAERRETLVFYESPRRLDALLAALGNVLGDRAAVLGREMTKLHEEFLRGRLSEIREALAARPAVRGECTLLVAGAAGAPAASAEDIVEALRVALTSESAPLSAVVQDVARRFGAPRREVYQAALALRRRKHDDAPRR